MTKFKVYRVNEQGQVTIEIVEEYDWYALINSRLYGIGVIFRVDVVGGQEPEDENG